MRSTIIGLAVLLALTTSGCGEKKRLEGELTKAHGQITELEGSLAQSHASTDSLADSLRSVVVSIERTRLKSDSLEKSYRLVAAKSKQLQKDLKIARAEFEKSLDSLQGIKYALDTTVRSQQFRIQGAETQVASLQQDILRVSGEKDSVYAVIDRVRPWLDYYKQESKRNWFKKLFGAGRAKKPQAPEPPLTPTIVPRLNVEES
ncbi:MAG: hypothetical protein HZB43_06990 [candidate division Zixibacteria bacterium]|nr:hypothetical protein [candidate division Zixibacteria bacterium]